jgi:5-methylcytosine-specific restriction endonuclease McrA
MRDYRSEKFNTPDKVRAERDRTRDYFRNNEEARKRNRERGRKRDSERWHTDLVYRKRKNEQAAVKNVRRRRYQTERGSFTWTQWVALCEYYNHRCLCCGRTFEKLSPDHVIPLSLGGGNTIDNIQPLCFPCNRNKGAKVIDYRPASTESLLAS